MKEHEKILQTVMRQMFRPHGFLQKGRSRLWFADRGWWVAVVELQPSAWDRGSYLNVGAMWLVYPLTHVAFHDGYRQSSGEFVPFKDPVRFEQGIRSLCGRAIEVVADLSQSGPTYADALARQEALLAAEDRRAGPAGPWNTYYTAAFALLAGNNGRAASLCSRLEAYQAQWDWAVEMKATALATLQSATPARAIERHVQAMREFLRLPSEGGSSKVGLTMQ